MADALQIIDFETNTINSAAAKIDENSIPSSLPDAKFISFYRAILTNLKEYQRAFEERNFNQLSRFDIEISKLIAKYFEKEGADSVRINSFLAAATSDAIDKFKSFLSSSIGDRSKLKTDDEVKDAISSAIEKHKKTIVSKIREELAKFNVGQAGSSDKKKGLKGAVEKAEDTAVAGTVAAVNAFLKKQDSWYTKKVSEFAAEISTKLMRLMRSSMRNVLDPTKNAKALRKRKGLGGPEELSPDDLVSAGDIIGKEPIWKLMAEKLKAFEKLQLGRKLKILAVKVPKRFAKFLGKYLLSLSIVLIGAVVHSVKILKNVFIIAKKTLLFGYKLIAAPIRLVYNIGAFAVRTSLRVLSGIYDVSKKIFAGLTRNPISKVVFGALVGFFSTYVGAYALGQLFGYLWYGIKKKLGINEEENPEEAMFERIKGSFLSAKQGILNAIDTAKEYLHKIPNLKEIQKRFLESDTYKALTTIATAAKWVISNAYTVLVPVVGALANFIGMFAGKDLLRLFGIYRKAKTGSLIGLYQLQKTAGRIIFKGGIAGLIAGAVVLGSAYAFSKLSKKKDQNKDKLKHYEVEFSLALGSDNANGIIHPEQVVRKLSKNNEKWSPLARQLIDISNSVEKDFIAYNDHLAVVSSMFGDDTDISTLPKNVPEELIKQILTFNERPIYRETDIRHILELDFWSQLMLCKNILEFKKDWINRRIVAFKNLTSTTEYSEDKAKEFSESNLNVYSSAVEFAEYLRTKMAETTVKKDTSADLLKQLNEAKNDEMEKFVSSHLSTAEWQPSMQNLQVYDVSGSKYYTQAQLLSGLSIRTKYLLLQKNSSLFSKEERKEITAEYERLNSQIREARAKLMSDTGYLSDIYGDPGSTRVLKELSLSSVLVNKFYNVVGSILEVLKNSFITSYIEPFRKSHSDIAESINAFEDFFLESLAGSFKENFLNNREGYENLKKSSMFYQKTKEVAEDIFVETISKVKKKYSEEPLSALLDHGYEDIRTFVKKMMEEKDSKIDEAIAKANKHIDQMMTSIDGKQKELDAIKAKEAQE